MEADRAEIAGVQRRGDSGAGGRPIGPTERFEPAGAPAFREAGIRPGQAIRQGSQQGRRDEGHVPGDTDDRGRRGQDRRVDPTQGPGSRTGVGDDPEPRVPGSGVLRVCNQDRALAQGLMEDVHEPVEDPDPPYSLEALGAAFEAGGLAASNDGATDPPSGRTQYALPRFRSRTTSTPAVKLKKCTPRRRVAGSRPCRVVGPVTAGSRR